jgi:hypothetical protein
MMTVTRDSDAMMICMTQICMDSERRVIDDVGRRRPASRSESIQVISYEADSDQRPSRSHRDCESYSESLRVMSPTRSPAGPGRDPSLSQQRPSKRAGLRTSGPGPLSMVLTEGIDLFIGIS